MQFIGFAMWIIPAIALWDGEFIAGGIGFLSLFLAWMTAVHFAGIRFVERPLKTATSQVVMLAFAIWLSTQTDWVFLVITGIPVTLLYVTLFMFVITYILTPRAPLAQEAFDRKMQNIGRHD